MIDKVASQASWSRSLADRSSVSGFFASSSLSVGFARIGRQVRRWLSKEGGDEHDVSTSD